MLASQPFILRKLLTILVFIGSVNNLFAQQQAVDSLSTAIRKYPQEDTVKVNMISDLAYLYHTIYPDSTAILSKQAYLLAKKLNYEKGVANALKHWAIGSYLTSNSELALNQTKEALAIYRKLNDKSGAAAVLNNIAIINHNEGKLDEALEYYNQSLTIRLEINNLEGIAGCYNNIGNVYTDKGDYSEALFYLFRALTIREKMDDQFAIANSNSNIANIYFLLGKYTAALNYGLKARDIQHNIGNKDGEMSALVAIGEVYHIQKNYTEAMEAFQQALILAKEIGSDHGITLCEINIGEVYLSQQQYAKAKTIFEHSLKLSEVIRDPEGIVKCHDGIGKALIHMNQANKAIPFLLQGFRIANEAGIRLRAYELTQSLSMAYGQTGDYKNAYVYLQKSVTYKDSLFNEEVTKKSQQFEFNFILDKKQEEIALLKKHSAIQKEIAERRRLANISMGVILLLSLTLALLLFLGSKKVKKANAVTLRQKEEISRQAEELQELNLLKDKIFSVLSHDLRSPIASLTGLMALMDQDMLTPEEFTKMRNGMNNQLSAISLLLDNLLYWSRSHISEHAAVHREPIDLVPLIEQNIQLLTESARQKNITLCFHAPASPKLTVMADVNHADIVIRNLISNAIKFTHPQGKVEVLSETTGNNITVSVRDTGIGIDRELAKQLFTNKLHSSHGTSGEKGTGLGLLLCRDFAEQNNGKLSVTSKPGEGSTFYFTLPKV
jgi:signal transduction histidine kinase